MNRQNCSISVIICTYTLKRFKDILDAVESIERQTYKAHEIIVSIDHNPELSKTLRQALPQQVTVTSNEDAPGLSDTRNAGIKIATGDIIAFIDDDAVADRNWLYHLASNYQNSEVMAVGGKIMPLWDEGQPYWFPEELHWVVGCTYKGHPQTNTRVRNVIGCNMSFRREIFDKVGNFTTQVGRTGSNPLGGEETEFCIRISQNILGAEIMYEPSAIVYHKVPKARQKLSYVLKRAYGEGASVAVITKQYSQNKPLSTESGYLRYLLTSSIPTYSSNAIRKHSAFTLLKASILVIVIGIAALAFIGTLFQRLRKY